MRYLVTWKFGQVPPEMAETALALNIATEAWLEGEKKAGTILEIWATSDSNGGIALVEAESNDALHKKIYETPYYPFMQFEVTPLTDMNLSFKAGQKFLKQMAGK
jgi:muconolactone delta-isomerase